MENLASEAVKILVEKLITTVTEEFKLVRGFKQEMEHLKESLLSINEVLEDAHERQVKDKPVGRWLDKLENLAYDAENVLDEIKYENLRHMVISTQKKPKGCFNITFYPPLAFRWKMAHKIQNINVKLNRLNKEATSRGFEKRLTKSTISMPEVKETDSYSVDPVFVGREKDISDLVKEVMTPSDEVISVLPIVGMGGIGKTTIARKIFNHQSIKGHFDKRIWISVSDKFDAMMLFQKILESLVDRANFAGMSRQGVVTRIREELKGKRYLLVLDDLWNKERKYWDDFKDTLLGVNPNGGNFIIVTTREADVASIVNPHKKYDLQLLKDDECWSIIRAKTFADKPVPEQFQMVGKEIAHQCRGVPLAAKMIGGVLAGKEILEWMSVRKAGPRKLEGDGDARVMDVLKISFNRLPLSYHKACFAYCSIFPKDADMNRKLLIDLWMAEGLVPDIQGSNMETTGNRTFHILFQNSFFQEPEYDKDGNIKYCKMHDLVHDLACTVSKSKSYIVDHSGDDIPQVRYLTILEEAALQIEKEKRNYLRTLMLLGGSMPYKNLADFTSLRTLFLFSGGEEEEDFPTSIAKLIHLKCLHVLGYRLKILPDSICKLYNLQTLHIEDCPVEEIPMLGHLPLLKSLILIGLEKVKSIRASFYGNGYCNSTSSNNGQATRVLFPKLKSLEIAEMDNITEWADAQMSGSHVFPCLEYLALIDCPELTALPSLRDARASLKELRIDGCSEVKELGCDLHNFESLETLSILHNRHLQLVAHPNAQKGLSSLRRLKFDSCPNLRLTGILEGCTSLQRLMVKDCDRLTSLAELSGMRSLEHLEVRDCRNLTSLPELSGMRSLQHLEVRDCRNLTSLPELSGMGSLQTLIVIECNLLPKLSGMGLCNNVRKLEIGNIGYFMLVPKSSFYDFFDNIECLKALEDLRIMGEPSWISLPNRIQHLTCLKKLRIIFFGMEALPDWLGNLSSLEELELIACTKLTKFPSKEAMQRLTKLTTLRILGCDLLQCHLHYELPKIIHIRQIEINGKKREVYEASGSGEYGNVMLRALGNVGRKTVKEMWARAPPAPPHSGGLQGGCETLGEMLGE